MLQALTQGTILLYLLPYFFPSLTTSVGSAFVSVQSCYGWLSWRRRWPARPYRREGEGSSVGDGIGIPDMTLFFCCQKAKRSIEKTNGVAPVKLLNFLVFEWRQKLSKIIL